MSILASLVRAYDRLPEKPEYGYSSQNIHFCIVLDGQGNVVGDPVSWGVDKRGKPTGRRINVPYFGGRSGSNAPPYFLWDNSAYVLGVSGKDNFDAEKRYAAFRDFHLHSLENSHDEALTALRRFLSAWTPSEFAARNYSEDILDRNIVFRLAHEQRFLHERQASQDLWAQIQSLDSAGEGICLVTGTHSQIARLHPPLASFENPARIVSFDKDNDAFSSYGHVQAENAPTSVEAAFAYTTALNRFLQRDSGHRIQIGDTSTVFWADAADREIAALAVGSFWAMIADDSDAALDAAETKKVALVLERLRKGEQLESIDPELARGVRFFVLGLAPNAARIAIRFWFEDDFGVLAKNYQRFVDDMRIEPPWHREAYPPLWRYLGETAVLGKRENVPANLAGAWMSAILDGTAYPRTLLATVLSRIRADGQVNALRVAMLKAVLVRNDRRRVPVALDIDNRDKGYLLGRLFAVYEQAQTAALGRNVNATIKDKFYGSASATPRNVFAVLDRGSANHLAKVGRDKPGLRVNLEKAIAAIMEAMAPDDDPFPASLSAAEQALFGLGYYHQRGEFFRKRDTAGTEEPAQ